MECATLSVPLDRADVNLGSVSLAVQRVAASHPQVGTIVLLAGGPGQAALPPFEELLAPLAKLPALRGYELVSFDQRGTGESGALECPGLLKEGLGALTKCGESLGASRADYASQESVEDLEALRQALGGPTLSLYAVSYGGKVAAMYAREHPAGVARMVLDSPVPLAGPDALNSQRPRALRRVLDEAICTDGGCRSFAPNPYGDLVKLLGSLRAHRMRARIFDDSGRPETVSVSEAGVYRLTGLMDLSQYLAGLVPGAVADAAHGDPSPLARLTNGLAPPQPTSTARSIPALGGDLASPESAAAASAAEESVNHVLSIPLFAATLCQENTLPWAPESLVASRAATLRSWISQLPAGITAPFTPITTEEGSAIEFCKGWPPTPAAPPPPSGESATPTLILSGDEDLRTPYEQDLTVAAGYSDVQILRIPDTGHSTVSSDRTGCAQRAMIAFLTGQPVPSSCPAPKASSALPPPAPSLSDVRPAGSRATLSARGAAAVALTMDEILGQTSLSGGGLHGGFWRVEGAQLVFHRVVDIPGVSISGSLKLANGTARLTIRGRVRGTLMLRGATLSGRLDGTRVRVRLTP
jgi:pimeloyl-ACP methyl ester carboxylesterase